MCEHAYPVDTKTKFVILMHPKEFKKIKNGTGHLTHYYLQSQYRLTGDKNSYVFLNRDDEPLYDIKRIRDKQWKKTLKVYGLDYRPIYHTRHTFATVMLENGEDIIWVSNMLGHTDSTMTLSRYARYVKRKERKRGQFLHKDLALKDTE